MAPGFRALDFLSRFGRLQPKPPIGDDRRDVLGPTVPRSIDPRFVRAGRAKTWLRPVVVESVAGWGSVGERADDVR